ncbi:hypothetical protein [Amycolatopsis orientalis]|uniref:hypothetical protein n=1 Tax=Amycolatopsis orientalis TaxID=31958 RepID=UPI000566AF63|nr:hypothetical protein [Amycolatopsis orientalis]
MNPLVKPPRALGTGTLAVAGLMTATVLMSGLSNSLDPAPGTGIQQVAFTTDPPPENTGPAKEKLKAKILAKMLDLAAPLDPADPKYHRKLYQQVLANRAIAKLSSPSISSTDIQSLLTDAFEIHRRSRQTAKGLLDRMSKVDEQVAALRRQVAAAKTEKARAKATTKLTQATNSRRELNKLLKAAEHHAKPFNRDAYIQTLKRAIWGLEQQVNSKLGKESKKKVNDRLDQARKDLATAVEDRERGRRRGDDDGGTPARRGDPRQPPKNPTTGARTSVTPKTGTGRVPTSGYGVDKALRGSSQVRAGIGAMQGVVPPFSIKEVHDNPYLPTAYRFAEALQSAPTEKNRRFIEDAILRHVLPDPHKRKTFLQALRDTYRPQIVPDGKGGYVKAVNPIRKEWEDHITRAFPTKVPTPRQQAIRKQEQIDRADTRRGGAIKKPLTPREAAILKQERIDREDTRRGGPIRRPVYSRQDAIAKQERIDRADAQRDGTAKKSTKKPTGKKGKNLPSAV